MEKKLMEVTMTRDEWFGLLKVLGNMLSQTFPIKFSYAMAKNRTRIAAEWQEFQDALKPNEPYQEYDKKRLELARSHAQKNDKGEPISVDGNFVIPDPVAWTKVFEALKDEHRATVDEYNAELARDITLELHGVKFEDLPERLTPAQVEAVMCFIDDGESDEEVAEKKPKPRPPAPKPAAAASVSPKKAKVA